MNLDLRQSQINRKNGSSYAIPVPYFTQIMAYAFSLPDSDIAFGKLAVDVQPAFACMQRRAAEITLKEQDAAAKAAAKARAVEEKAAKTSDGRKGAEAAATAEAGGEA
jgi:hypothetical protein